jgi:hypothetical protein
VGTGFPSRQRGTRLRGDHAQIKELERDDDSKKSHPALAVVFQEVVHPIRTEEAEVAKLQCSTEDRMDVHKNAPLTPKGRETMVRSAVEGGLSKAAAARQFNTAPKIVAKWVERFRAGGVAKVKLDVVQ